MRKEVSSAQNPRNPMENWAICRDEGEDLGEDLGAWIPLAPRPHPTNCVTHM